MSLQTVAAAAYLVIALNRKKRRKPRWWRRELYVDGKEIQCNLYNKLVADDEALFRNFTRMSKEDLQYLFEKISPIIRKCDTNFREAIPPRVRLLVTLRYLATGDSYASLMYLFRISEPSISRIIPEVCRALMDVLHDSVKVSKNMNILNLFFNSLPHKYFYKIYILQYKYKIKYNTKNKK